MMKKTGAGGLVVSMFFVLHGFWGAVAGAQDAVGERAMLEHKASPEQAVSQIPDSISALLPPTERLRQLQSADLAELQEARKKAIAAAQFYSEQIPGYRQMARQAYEDARLNSPEAQAMRQEIQEMEASLHAFLSNLPDVTQYDEAIQQAEKSMLAELELRTALGVLIAQKGGADEANVAVDSNTPEQFPQ